MNKTPRIGISLPVEFTDREIASIIARLSYSSTPPKRRLSLFPQLLREWARRDLADYVAVDEAIAILRASQKGIKGFLKRAGEMSVALESLERSGHLDELASALQFPRALRPDDPKTDATLRTLFDLRLSLPEWTKSGHAYQQHLKRSRGQPINFTAHTVLLDLVSIYEWATDESAKRTVDRDEYQEAGPFFHFAAGVWPIVFASGGDGLSAAMRRFGHKRATERSGLIANMNTRFPEWGLFMSAKE